MLQYSMTSKTLQERIEHTKKVKLKQKEQQYRSMLKKYNLTPEQKLEMARKQQYKCANLKCINYLNWSNISNIAVDHCHTTGKVRGLLCNGCNTMLGILESVSERKQGLLEYLESNK